MNNKSSSLRNSKALDGLLPSYATKLWLIVSVSFLYGALSLFAANVSLTASDASGASSFNSAGNWSNLAAPAPANSYFTTNYLLRTPSNSVSYFFGGGSLSVDPYGFNSTAGRFLLKGPGGATITVTNLIINGGLVDYANLSGDNGVETLAGRILLNSGTSNYLGALPSETLFVTAPISGGGNLQIAGSNINSGSDNGTVMLSGTNSYTGNTTVAGGVLALTNNGSLASSNISLSAGATFDVSGQNSPVLAASQNLLGGGSVKGTLTTAATSKIIPGTDGTAGTLTFNNSLTMALGSTFNLDVSASSSSGNDNVSVTGTLALNGNAINLRALGGVASLDTNADYALVTAGGISGNTNLSINWVGTSPANATNYSVLVTTTQLKLHFTNTNNTVITNTPTPLSAVGAANPSVVTNGQTILLTVAVTPATSPASTGITVTADVSALGGVTNQTFYDNGTHGDQTNGDNVFSFSTTVPTNASPSVKTISVTVTDAQARNATAQIALTVLSAQTQYFPATFLPISNTAISGGMPLAANGVATPIYYSTNDATVVGIAANALSNDVRMVTGLMPVVSSNAPSAVSNVVFIGTVGSSVLIDGLVSAGKINVSAIQGQWESYIATIVTNPIAGVNTALVIAGSDRRGTAYGVFGLSETMGVSPWYWFADVPATQQSAIYVGSGTFTQLSSSVKYRGIFINDEDWSLEPWAAKTFDPAGNIGPATYAKVFELLLRLHANYIWPAMHPSTTPFYTVAGNKQTADNYAIAIGTSHQEPMERNTAEYNTSTLGPYDYWINANAISNYWDQRVLQLTNFDAVYTVGMRGLSDSGIIAPSGTTVQQEATEMQNVIIPNERTIISNHINPNPALVPQIFVPYKEALSMYQTGMQLPDDVTLVWPDDNFGYIRELSTTTESARGGSSGVYYHIEYWGSPANYMWLGTTPPGVIWEEMSKAWDYQANRLWVLNVGGLKPREILMEFFLRLARNPEAFRNFSPHAYLAQWAAENFGAANADAIATVLEEYYRLNFITRPEHLNTTTSGFNFIGAGDQAQQRLNDFSNLVSSANSIYAQLTPAQQTAFYEMVLYPIRGSALQNIKILDAERSRLWATQGRAATATMAAAAQAAQNSILSETAFYNQTNAGGKWNYEITVNTGGQNYAPFVMPTVGSYTPPAAAGLGVAVEDSASVLTATNAGLLPTFNVATNASHFIDIFNTGTTPMPWIAQSSAPWILLNQTSGTNDARLWVRIDWAHAPQSNSVTNGRIAIQGAGTVCIVNVNVFNPASINPATLPAAVENDGVVYVEAENFTSSHASAAGVGWQRIARAAVSYDGMMISPTTAASIATNAITSDTPSLTYQFYTVSSGAATIQMACLPTEFINTNHPGCRYAISLNGDTPQIVDISAVATSSTWSANVLVNTAYGTTTHTITNAGLQTVTVWMIDPGVVLDKFTVSLQNPVSGNSALVYYAALVNFTTPYAYHTFTDAAAAGGIALSLDATAVGQYITLTASNVPAGAFNLTVLAKTWNTRGIAQVSIANSAGGPFTNIGSPLDFYTASATYTSLPMIQFTNPIAGTVYFKFTVTGQNPSSTGYLIVPDSLTLTPILTPSVPSSPALMSMSVGGNNLNLTWPGGLGWRLQMQTNSPSVGLGTNWIYVTGGLIFSTNIPVNPNSPATFFRLSYP